MERKAISIREFCATYCVSRSTTYNLINANKLRPIKVGMKTLIPVTEAARWWSTLNSEKSLSAAQEVVR